MKQRIAIILAAIILCGLVCGCAAVFSLAAEIIGLMRLGKALGIINDSNPTRYTIYMDGYSLSTNPSTSGAINVAGMPEGVHLLSLSDSTRRRGFNRQLRIVAGGQVNLGEINPFDGAAIRGRLTRQTTGSGAAAVAGAQVIAVCQADELLNSATGQSISIPPAFPADPANPDVEYIAGFTDNNGNYVLGPARYGRWIVFAAQAGYLADATVAIVSAGNDATGRNLNLTIDPVTDAGAMQGNVGSPIAGQSLVYATLQTPFVVQVPDSGRSSVESQLGVQLIDGPWFTLERLGVLGATSGAYFLTLPAGRQSLVAFKYGCQAQEGVATVTTGQTLSLDFQLPRRG